MTENQLTMIQEAQAFVTDLLSNKLSKNIRFHNLEHTEEVVAACEKLAEFYHLTDEEQLPLFIAAWFHDTGYVGGKAKDHEALSIQLATEFLSAQNAPLELSGKVVNCISATKMPQSPNNSLENILCDADLFHLGSDTFREKTKLLRKELKNFGENSISKNDWLKTNIDFLEAHKYFTTYGQETLQPIKEVHIKALKAELNELDDHTKKSKKSKNTDDIVVEALKIEDDKKKKKEKNNQSERGIATVFRIMAQNQNNLSQMADSKANILISVNAIILSIVISSLITKLDANPNLQIPFIILVVICVSTIIFSILATRPNVNHGKFTQDDIHNKRTNLLFFGNFFKMSLPDYDWAMGEMMNDKDYLYSSIVKDTYFLGVVLAKKYRLLRIAYNIFMYGLILVILAFLLANALPHPIEVYTPG